MPNQEWAEPVVGQIYQRLSRVTSVSVVTSNRRSGMIRKRYTIQMEGGMTMTEDRYVEQAPSSEEGY